MSKAIEESKKDTDDTIAPENMTTFLKQYVLTPIDEGLYSVFKVASAVGLGHMLTKLTWRSSVGIIKQVLKNFFNLKIEGHEHIPRNKPAIICSRSSAGVYPFLAWIAVSDSTERILYQAFDGDFFTISGIRTWLYYLDSFSILDGFIDAHTEDFIHKKLADGELIGLTLENSKKDDNETKIVPSKQMIEIAKKNNVPIVPIATPNIDEIINIKEMKMSLNQKVVIKIHERIDVSSGSVDEIYKKLEKIIKM